MKVPYFTSDLFESDRQTILDLVYATGTSQEFILKSNVAKLESQIRDFTAAAYAIAVANGTGAVGLALRSLGIGRGDEVIVPAYCFQSVASTVIDLGATPVFIDSEPRTMVMDAGKIEERITPRTRAILPAHLFSIMVDMPKVMEVARRHNLKVVEDACMAQGASLNGRLAGLWGDIGTYSFFQVKVMGGIGEAGTIVTNDSQLGRTCQMLRNHGQDGIHRFLHHMLGVNSRMDEIVAGFLLHRFANFDWLLSRRAEIAEYYNDRFAKLEEHIILPPRGQEGRCYYVYSIQTPKRDNLKKYLAERGIGSHVYYSRILPQQKAFTAYADPRFSLENAERASCQNLALPIYPHLTDSQVEAIADAVLEFFNV